MCYLETGKSDHNKDSDSHDAPFSFLIKLKQNLLELWL